MSTGEPFGMRSTGDAMVAIKLREDLAMCTRRKVVDGERYGVAIVGRLLADAKLAENAVEHVVGADGADDFAEGGEGGANFGGDEFVAGGSRSIRRRGQGAVGFAKAARQRSAVAAMQPARFACERLSTGVRRSRRRKFIEAAACNAAVGTE